MDFSYISAHGTQQCLKCLRTGQHIFPHVLPLFLSRTFDKSCRNMPEGAHLCASSYTTLRSNVCRPDGDINVI